MSKKTFSCIKCGFPIEVYPPDDLHTIATRREVYKDNIPIDYKCPNCGEINTIYWGYPQPSVHVG